MTRLKITPLAIADVKIIAGPMLHDHRGFFGETWNRRDFAEAGIDIDFVQDNRSRCSAAGTVRGLHFQAPPFAQAKLVRVTRGRMFDVVVDLRKSSPSYGCCVAVELAGDDGLQLLIPKGFAHGFCTLEANTEIAYKVDAYYSAAHDRGINWRDPALGIDWPIAAADAVLSQRDRTLPLLRDFATPFA